MKKLYKVLSANGDSQNGGSQSWPLPTEEGPGDWVSVPSDKELQMCKVGLHLTEDPNVWLKNGCRIFEVEGKDFLLSAEDNLPLHQKDKVVCRSARLLRELTDEECVQFGLFRSGEHTVSSGTVYASGSAIVHASGSATVKAYDSATVLASGSATVRAYNSATVRAYNSATVRASDSATVHAFDSATVWASGSATVFASGSATVQAYDSATVRASGSATVKASDSATVWAYGSVTVQAFHSATVKAFDSVTVILEKHSAPTITLAGNAVQIDRRPDGKPILSTEP
jgi:hypothetical protein